MSLMKDGEGTLIHYPAKPDMFEFDADVAEVFDNMADRSIPLYKDAHTLHARLARRWIDEQLTHKDQIRIHDIGASTGGFYEALHKEYWVPYHTQIGGVVMHASDISRPMLDKVNEKLPNVLTFEQDVGIFSALGETYDMINCSYVLQFLKPREVVGALREIRHSMNDGGVLFLSQKEKVSTGWGNIFQERYIDFRRENGYSVAEIEAKTAALKNSMWPQTAGTLRQILESAGFGNIQETSRWLQFSSLVATVVV